MSRLLVFKFYHRKICLTVKIALLHAHSLLVCIMERLCHVGRGLASKQ